jgi:hypothetical protein
MGLSELSKPRSIQRKPIEERCGASHLTSAKATTQKMYNVHPETHPEYVMEYLSKDENWPYNAHESEHKHKEFVQSEEHLSPSYTWEADNDVNTRFDAHKVDTKDMMKKRNVRTVGVDTQGRTSNYFRQTGLNTDVRASCNPNFNKQPVMSETCTDFLTTDSYHSFRMSNAK